MSKKIILDTVVTPDTVSWFINRKSDFTGEVIPAPIDSTNTSYITIPVMLNGNDVVYVKAILNYPNSKTLTTETMVVTKDSTTTTNKIFVYPPTLLVHTYGFSKPHITVDIDSPKFYVGDMEHKATTWRIRDNSGNVIFTREYDIDNLLSIDIPESFYIGHNSFVVEAQYEFDVDLDVWGREPIVREKKSIDLAISKDRLTADIPNTIAIISNRLVGFEFAISVTSLDGTALDYQYPIYNSFILDGKVVSGFTEVKIQLTAIKENKRVRREFILPVLKNEDKLMTIFTENPTTTVVNGMVTNVFKKTVMLDGAFPTVDILHTAINLYELNASTLSVVATNALIITNLSSDYISASHLDSDTYALELELSGEKKMVTVDKVDGILTLSKIYDMSALTNFSVVNSEASSITAQGVITSTNLLNGVSTNSNYDHLIISGTVYLSSLLDGSFLMVSDSGEYFFTEDNVVHTFETTSITNVETYPSTDGAIVVAGSDFGFKVYHITKAGSQVVTVLNNVINDYRVIFDPKNNKIFMLGA